MPGYGRFGLYYDTFNTAADYDALAAYILNVFSTQGLPGNIVADLGCGTGEVTLRLAKAGYDMIAIDASAEMLDALLEKKYELEPPPDILLLQQDLRCLDLYGTIQGAVCTFDTLNHIGPQAEMEKVLARTALFMEPGGLFVFDVNTLYKHETVLGAHSFELEGDGATCKWDNLYSEKDGSVQISMEITPDDGERVCEEFTEYYYSDSALRSALERSGFAVLSVLDGESFTPSTAQSQRLVYVTKRR